MHRHLPSQLAALILLAALPLCVGCGREQAAQPPALGVGPTVELSITPDRTTFERGEDIVITIRIKNTSTGELDAPTLLWACRLILDGKEYERLQEHVGDWNGPGVILSGAHMRTGFTLYEYGVTRDVLTVGQHKVAVRFEDALSNTLKITITEDPVPADVPADVREQIDKLRSADAKERNGAIMKLRSMRAEAKAAVPILIHMLGIGDESPQMRLWGSSRLPLTSSCTDTVTVGGEVAETLARIGADAGSLIPLLKDPDWRVRANTARALGGLKDTRAVEPLIAVLKNAEEHPEVRGNAALALRMLKDARALQPLLAALPDADPRVRKSAARALGALEDPQAVDPLIGALKDGDEHVRMDAAGALGGIQDPRVVEPLIEALQNEHRQVREVTAIALGRVGDPRAVEPLVAALNDEYVNVQINAARALGEIGEIKALEPLMRALADPEGAVRAQAAMALGKIGDHRAIDPLVVLGMEEIGHIETLSVLQALEALGHAGGAEAMKQYGTHRSDWEEWWAENKEGLLLGK